MYIGVDYYPEQWGLNYLEEDFKTIKELGANLIRIGEFAWDKIQKPDESFDFSFSGVGCNTSSEVIEFKALFVF